MAMLGDNETLIRYLHILSGIVWIGMLYFFNLVNLPLLKFGLKKPYEANMAEKATAPITIKTLFWFRWGAFFTLLWGLLLLEIERQQYAALGGLKFYFLDRGMQGYSILLGGLLAILMAFNVWFIIWPRQQKILANNKAVAATTDDVEKKRLADTNAPLVKTATMASRANTWMSVPMLWGMVFGAHGYMGATTARAWLLPLGVLAALLLLMASASMPKKTQA